MATPLARYLHPFASIALALLLLQAGNGYCSGIEVLMQRFAMSEFVFQRTRSNAPFPPLAYLSAQSYHNSEINTGSQGTVKFDQTSVSQAVVAPLLLSSRDALLVGEWAAWNRFSPQQDGIDSFDVTSVGLPLGWMRQVNPELQTAAFIFPMAHRAKLDQAKTSYENMAGAFARFYQSETLWWGAGLFVDVNPGDNLYLPYLGFSWSVNPRWTISALMPWPGVMYSPTTDTTFRLGASPSSTAWKMDAGEGEAYYEWAQWNLGLSVQQRMFKNFWLQAEAGVSGLRTLSVERDRWQQPEIDSHQGSFISASFNWRPGAPGGD